MTEPRTVELGAFAAGEVPPDLQIVFTDFDGNVVDLTGYTAEIRIQEELGAELGMGDITITSPAGGEATYEWVRDDMLTVGEYTVQAWVLEGALATSKRFASDLYLYSVYDGPGTPPL
jgi:hypothetical protein